MTTKKLQKGGTKGKAEGGKGVRSREQLRADDAQTAERIRSILSHPQTSERVTLKLTGLVNKLCEHANADTLETPNFYAEAFAGAAGAVRDGDMRDPAALTAFAQVALYAEQHEPKDARLVREVAAAITGPQGSALFESLTQLESETQVYAQHPQAVAAWLTAALAEARRMLASTETDKLKRRGLRHTLAEIARLANADESPEATGATGDARLVRTLLSRAFPTKKHRDAAAEGGAYRDTIPDVLLDLGNEISTLIIHPDILPHALPVIIREARAVVRQKAYGWKAATIMLRKLEDAAK